MIKKGCIIEIILFGILSLVLTHWNAKLNALADIDMEFRTVTEKYARMSLYENDLDSLMSQVREGDKSAYFKVRKKLSQDELLPYSLLMANKFNCKEACFDIYCIFSNIYGTYALDSLDAYTRNIAVYYLNKSNSFSLCE